MEGFLGFDKCLVVFMLPNRQISIDFVNVVYEGCFSRFNFMHNNPDSFLLIKDGILMHGAVVATSWTQAHCIKIL